MGWLYKNLAQVTKNPLPASTLSDIFWLYTL